MAHFGKDIDNITTSSSVQIIKAENVETHTVIIARYLKNIYNFHFLFSHMFVLSLFETNKEINFT